MSIPQLDNTPRCQYVRLSGRQCKGPARRGNNYCLFHEAEHVNEANLTFPPVEDAATVAVATDQVLQALRDDTIDFHRAALLFSGLRIARAKLKLLGLELGDAIEDRLGAAGPTKDPDDLPDPRSPRSCSVVSPRSKPRTPQSKASPLRSPSTSRKPRPKARTSGRCFWTNSRPWKRKRTTLPSLSRDST